METKETEQGRQYKEYTREATGNKAERSAQLLGGEFWYESRSSTTRLEGSLSAACFFAYSSQSISWKREKRLPFRSICSKNIFSGRTQYLRSPQRA